MISYEDFLKVDIRVGTVLAIYDFDEARNPSYKLTIDFGPEIGVKKSSAQFKLEQTKKDLLGKQVLAVVNFPVKKIANFNSEVLVLGLRGEHGGWIAVTPMREVENGERLA